MAGAVVVATFASHGEALIARSFLQAQGLSASLGEAHHAQTDLVAGAALGGFRLFVPASEAEEARALLASVAESGKPACPRCGSERVAFVADRPANWFVAVVSFLIAAAPLLRPQRRYHCLDCAERWNPD